MNKNIIKRCEQNGLRMTEQRRIVAQVLDTSHDHPDVEELYARASKLDPKISIAVYVENAGWGARAALSTASLVIEKYLNGSVKKKWLENYVLKVCL